MAIRCSMDSNELGEEVPFGVGGGFSWDTAMRNREEQLRVHSGQCKFINSYAISLADL